MFRTARFSAFAALTLSASIVALTPSKAFERIAAGSSLKSAYVLPIADAETVSVQVVFRAGESNMTGPEGIAHYIEHLVQWSREGGPGAKLGVHGRNAWANAFLTAYFSTGNPQDLPELIAKSKIYFSPPNLPRTFMENEKKVVLREYDLSVSENPQRRFFETMSRALYGSHPMARSVIGTKSSIKALDIDHAFALHRKFYRPANATVIIAGKFDKDIAAKLIKAAFPKKPGANQVPIQLGREQPVDPTPFERTIEKTDQQVKAAVVFLRKVVTLPSSAKALDARELALLNDVLGSARPGSLAGPLVFDRKQARKTGTYLKIINDRQFEFLAWMEPEQGISTGKGLELLKEVISETALTGVPPKTLDRIRKRFKRKLRRTYRDIDKAIRFAPAVIQSRAPLQSLKDAKASLDAITKSDLDHLLTAILKPGPTVSGALNPPKSKKLTTKGKDT